MSEKRKMIKKDICINQPKDTVEFDYVYPPLDTSELNPIQIIHKLEKKGHSESPKNLYRQIKLLSLKDQSR